jgi:hypothetical protein
VAAASNIGPEPAPENIRAEVISGGNTKKLIMASPPELTLVAEKPYIGWSRKMAHFAPSDPWPLTAMIGAEVAASRIDYGLAVN